MELETRISAWLKARGLTQSALASLVGVTDGAVSLWVSGETSPSQDNLVAIAKALGLTMEKFYGRIPKPKTKAA